MTPLDYESPQTRQSLPWSKFVPRLRVVVAAITVPFAYLLLTRGDVIWYTGTHPNYLIAVEYGDIRFGPPNSYWTLEPSYAMVVLTLAVLAAQAVADRVLATLRGAGLASSNDVHE